MTCFEENVLIEASAGTGKTQALAERLIALIRGGVKPHEIVALTFSRAAAGEIFERFVKLLAESALIDPKGVQLLRDVIATQHLSQIGTLDSFLMRMVRSFPLELGLVGDIEMLDDYGENVERGKTAFGILRRTDESIKRNFVEAFALALNHENVRSFAGSYRDFVRMWHDRYLENPDERSWQGFPFVETSYETTANEALAPFFEWVKGFRGSFDGVKGVAKKLLDDESVFSGATIEVSYRRKNLVFDGRDAKAIRDALTCVFGRVIRMRSEMARGIHKMISAYERAYDRRVRRCGKLVFSDLSRLVCALGDQDRLALEYRMDAHIRAWALDEFQDTSREQWRALADLIEQSKQSAGEKSVFVVGDRKQAIYGWRNGDVGIFTRERDSGAYEVRELNRTFRSCAAVVDAVNRVFVDGGLKNAFPTWRSPVHVAANPDLQGFVQVVEASGPKKKDFVVPVLNALRAVDPVRRNLSVAVLVRTNEFGEQLVAELKTHGLNDVVWEGDCAIADTPALEGFMDLVRLADHPGDRQSFAHFRTTPIASLRYPDGVPDVEVVSAEAALAFTTKGLARTFRELRALLPESPEKAWSGFSERRFDEMLRAATEFELAMEPGTRLSDFAAFLSSKKVKVAANPGKICVMTIHRSKGLGFDYVVLPLYEPKGMEVNADGPLIGDGWIFPDLDKRVARTVPELDVAWWMRQERAEQEALCIYYVAMTRAKRAMTIVLHPQDEKSTTARFSAFVRGSLPAAIGAPDWYLSVPRKDAAGSAEKEFPGIRRAVRRSVARRLPSLQFADGQSAGCLFDASSGRRAAMLRGNEIHSEYERVEWVERTAARDDFDRALIRPVKLTALWREVPFEVFVDGEWMSGRFDRVVFADGRAEVHDFKTNAMRRGESVADFEQRMRMTYAGQMSAYRKAVVALTGLPIESVSAKLLLTASRSVAELR